MAEQRRQAGGEGFETAQTHTGIHTGGDAHTEMYRNTCMGTYAYKNADGTISQNIHSPVV